MLEFHPVHKYLGLLLLAATACDSDGASVGASDAGADAGIASEDSVSGDRASVNSVSEDGGSGDGAALSSETGQGHTNSDETGLSVGHDTAETSAQTSATGSGATAGSDTSSASGITDTSADVSDEGTVDTELTAGAGSNSETGPGTDTGLATHTGPGVDTSSSDTGASDTGASDTDVTSTSSATASTSDSTSSTDAASDATTSELGSAPDSGVTSGDSSAVTSAPPDDTGTPGIMFEDDFDAEAIDGSGYTFNYTAFDQWTVIGGTVDLISFPNQLLASPGGYGNSQPASGVTVDLNGSNGHEGVLETQRSFTFHAGVTYQISYSLGSPFAETNGVRVEVMGVSAKEESQVGILPFAAYSATFTPDTTTTAKLRITSFGGNDNVGLFLDSLSLERLP